MKVVILAGGKGTRLSERTNVIPKPMVEIGGKPILWHIMKIYSHYGFNDFIICLGYLGYVVKEYFSHYFLHMSDFTIDMEKNETRIHSTASEPWKVTLVDTGQEAMTGSRIRKIRRYVGKETFMLTYGDTLADINIGRLAAEHRKNGRYATLIAVQTAGRFGVMELGKGNAVRSFLEKPKGEGSWINAGFFVLEPEVFDYIGPGDSVVWERGPLEKLAADRQLSAHRHGSFWRCMDTLRDKLELEKLWETGNAPWKAWK